MRLPDTDDQIIDRALGAEPLANRKVTLLTYDTGQSMRARNAGLLAVRILATADPDLRHRMTLFQDQLAATARAKGEALRARRADGS